MTTVSGEQFAYTCAFDGDLEGAPRTPMMYGRNEDGSDGQDVRRNSYFVDELPDWVQEIVEGQRFKLAIPR